MRAKASPVNPSIIVAGTDPDSTTEPLLTIIVPTRNEAENIEALYRRLHAAAAQLPIELIFVDDSTDSTAEVIATVGQRYAFKTTVIARPPERRNGLGMAVVEGIQIARAPWVAVMDGDLQHPPELIPALLERARSGNLDLVAGSRLAAGGKTAGLSPFRRLVSYSFAAMTRLFFPRQLRRVTDPLTGFFLFRRQLVDPARLHPRASKSCSRF